MSQARRIALFIARNSFRLVLVGFITIFALISTFDSPGVLKEALSATKSYDKFVPALLEANAKQDKDSVFADPKVREIMSNAFPPQFLQLQSDMLIDSTYAWLRGEQITPAFRIDIADQREKLAEALSIYGIERLSALPTCTAFESEIQLDPFKATCQPAGINYKSEQVSLQRSLLDSDSFLSKTAYTEADLPKTKDGKTIPEALRNVPLIFRLLKPSLLVLGLLLLLLSTVIVVLRPLKRNGLIDLGKALLYSCLLLAVSGAIFGIFIPKFSQRYQSQFTGNGADALMAEVMTYVTTHFEIIFINVSMVLALLGGEILLSAKFAPRGSRYKRLEHVTGITNGVAPRRLNAPSTSRASRAPVVSSEKLKTRGTIRKMNRKNQRAKREVS
jgi:hypothetical protein